ncbi:MAG: protein kinase [Myxococcales bacterium]|nr:protein kinase [Myxococcales bacterium]
MSASARVIESEGRRYLVGDEIAAGGMARVHIGVQLGAGGFRRVVAIKQLHPHLAKDPEFLTMFLDEARMASRVHHRNVVHTLDVIANGTDVLLVMEYVAGASLSAALLQARRKHESVPFPIAVAITCDSLRGLAAAHGALDSRGHPLELVHRDVSPQNVLVGLDGVSRLADFGVAKARGRLQVTEESKLKGKLAYMAPELLRGEEASPASDVFGMGVVLWEMLAGRRLFGSKNEAETIGKILSAAVPALGSLRADVPDVLDRTVRRALDAVPEARPRLADELARELESSVSPASPVVVQTWLEALLGEPLQERAAILARAQAMGLPAVVEHPEPPSAPATSLPTSPVGTATPSRRVPVLVVVGTALLATCALAVGLNWRPTRPVALPSTSGAPLPDPPSPIASALPPALAIASIEVEPPTPPSASALSSAVGQVRALPARRPVKSAAGARPAPTSPGGATPPGGTKRDPRCYSVDANGIWKIKPECL